MKRAFSLLAFVILAFSQMPMEFTYQGKLTNSSGMGINDDLPMTFRLFNTASGGTAFWEESHPVVTIDKGLFSVALGSITSVSGDMSGTVFLEITIDGDVLSPRVKITPSANAMYALVADSISGGRATDDDITDNTLDELLDVNIADIETDDYLSWDGAEWVNGPLPVTDDITDDNLEDLFDVQITSAAEGQVLSWDGTRWINIDAPTGDDAYNTDFSYNDGTDELSITDGDGTLTVTIDNEADMLTDNVISDLSDVNTAGVVSGRVLVYNGSQWIPGDPLSATDNQTDVEVPLTSTGDFTFIDGETNVHGALDDLDAAIGALDDGNPATTTVTWYDISSIPPGFSDGIDNTDHVTNLTFSDASDQLILTDGGGTLIANIENEADDLTDNEISDIGDVSVDTPEEGDILHYMEGEWINAPQTDEYILLSDTTIFSHISGETDLIGALDEIDNTLQWILDDPDLINDGDTLIGNEYIEEVTWNEIANRLTISDGGADNEIMLTGFAEDDHSHEFMTPGDGLTGGTYDGTTPRDWDILTGHGLDIYMDSLVLDDGYTSGAIYDGLYVSHADSAGGDARGTFDSLKVTKIQGRPVSADAPGFGSLMAWNGTEWGLTTATLTWADSGNFIRPTTDSTVNIKIYDKGDTSALKIEEIDGDRTGIWRGISVERKGNIESKGYAIYGDAGAVSDIGASASISEFYGVYGKAGYGRYNYGVYGYAPSAPVDCEAYGVYGEGQTGGGWFYGPDNDGEKATLKIQSGSQTMLIDGNEIDVTDHLYIFKNSDSSNVSVGYVGGEPDTRLHVMGGLAIGGKQSTQDDLGFVNSIQLATSTIGDEPLSPDYDNHTGTLIYSDLDGTWGDGSLNFHIGTGWGTYTDLPSFKVYKDGVNINPESIDERGTGLSVHPSESEYYCATFHGESNGVRIYNNMSANEGSKNALYIRQYNYPSSYVAATQKCVNIDADGEGYAGSENNPLYGIYSYTHDGGGDLTALYGCAYGCENMAIGVHGWGQSDDDGGISIGVKGYAYHSASADNTYGVYASASGSSGADRIGIYASTSDYYDNFGGVFDGNVQINGSISKSSGSFLIDHPDDPYNKTLRHNFVESPEDLCMYRGKVELDEDGMGIVEMPSYFKGLTKEDEASANLTPVGRPFPTGCEWNDDFTKLIVYGDPGRAVFWTVYADRDDPYIRWSRPRMPIEEDKKTSVYCDEGLLLSPQAYGLPKEEGYMYKKHHIEPPVQEQEKE